MNKILNTLGYEDISLYGDKVSNILSKYSEKIIDDKGTVHYEEKTTKYFINNNVWDLDFFKGIAQFNEEISQYESNYTSISFSFDNWFINNEMKLIVYNKLFLEEWNLFTTFNNKSHLFKYFALFFNQKYPNLNSILDLNLDKANLQWIDWINNIGLNTKVKTYEYSKIVGKDIYIKNSLSNFISFLYDSLFKILDSREEWIKDIWDVRNLSAYGINFNNASDHMYINFSIIKNSILREVVKKYFKERLISGNKFSWGTAIVYHNYICKFINYINEIEPDWNDFNNINRQHILKYMEWLRIHAKENITKKNANNERYISNSLSYVYKFLGDIQVREYDSAPIKSVKALIYTSDKPTPKKKAEDQIDYVPNFVLEQLFDSINKLNKNIVPLVWIMYKTGLRISDALELTQDCLIRVNSKFWIKTDIEKTYVKGHKIPIDDELANMIAVLIDESKEKSNDDNNPNKYIFVRYSGSRKGRPYSKSSIQRNLNLLAIECNITDELGEVFHFKNHAFRHTYAIKLLNGGADILTVQELLAHASPEMTMRYAKLLDDTKRKTFDNAVKNGVFSFDEGAALRIENNGEIPDDVLDMLWTNHKLSAIDTPYGTCLQRANGKCNFAKQPPCLTCNSGNPCKDLCVGAFEGDVKKYEILIQSTESLIENAKIYNRKEMIKENEELLQLFKDIYYKIIDGNIIYSRLDRLKKGGNK